MAEDGCYIMALSSMEHPDCPPDPDFVRGERLVYHTHGCSIVSLYAPGRAFMRVSSVDTQV